MLGIAAKARKCVFGAEAFIKSARMHKIFLALLSDDTADNTRKKVVNTCAHYGIEMIELEADKLGASVGKPAIKVVGIIDKQLSGAILSKRNI